ncbi:MAG: DUF438 domain-containing protein, partial [Candidatus Thorarchaeota archaeon]
MASERKKILKEIAVKIGAGEDLGDIKRYFVENLGGLNPVEVSFYQDEFIKEGVTQEAFQILHEMSLEVFRDVIQNQKPIVPKGHPIHTLMAEHALLMEYANELQALLGALSNGEREPKPEFLGRIRQLVGFFVESESHYLREENTVFPSVEKHGLTGPPKAMWSEHQEIHAVEKNLFDLNSDTDNELIGNLKKMSEVSLSLADILASHFYKENNILFPAAIRLFSEQEWDTIVQDFDDIGYCSYSIRPAGTGKPTEVVSVEGEVVF